MSTSGIDRRRAARNRLWKGVGAWLGAAGFAFVLDKVYALFAHGVESPYLQFLFLFPLLGGVMVYALLAVLAPGAVLRPFWRAGCNLYNAGLATAAAGSLLRGIFEIAGTGSVYTAAFFALGAGLMAVGALLLALPARPVPDKREIPGGDRLT